MCRLIKPAGAARSEAYRCLCVTSDVSRVVFDCFVEERRSEYYECLATLGPQAGGILSVTHGRASATIMATRTLLWTR